MSHSDDAQRLTRKQGLTISELDDEVLVYDPETTRASCLNAFAAEVLKRCDGTRTAARIAEELPFENVDTRVVMLALADLQKAGLLEADTAIDLAAIIGPSRRDFFRRIGLGAAIAAPVVTGITMPAAAQSFSFPFCNDDMDCPNGTVCLQRRNGQPCPPNPPQAACTCQEQP